MGLFREIGDLFRSDDQIKALDKAEAAQAAFERRARDIIEQRNAGLLSEHDANIRLNRNAGLPDDYTPSGSNCHNDRDPLAPGGD